MVCFKPASAAESALVYSIFKLSVVVVVSTGAAVWIWLDNNPVGAEIKGKEYYKWVINRKKLLRAISRWFTEYYYPKQIKFNWMYKDYPIEIPSSFSDIDFDAGDTDIIIQLAIFNEVIYG